MANEYTEKLRSISYLSRGRSRPRVREGRQHPETGVAFKATTDEVGNTVTEHNLKGDRQDVTVRPQTIHTNIEELRRGAK